ncbi:GTPase-activating protein [Haplosporangium sp. Z 27]|nr:GTPase-activating protein [Haplosporangium sp. Z 27]
MMVNKSNKTFASQDDLDYDPIDSYGTTSDAAPNSGHEHSHTKGHFIDSAHKPLEDALPIKNSRTSWEEDGSDDELYPENVYTYGRDDIDNSESDINEGDEEHSHNISSGNSQSRVAETFDQAHENEIPQNRNLFRASASNPRVSVNSNRSYSSHTKHHSFGYDQDRPELSESESNSESESDQDETYINAPSSPSPPLIPSVSRPSSTLVASYTYPKPDSPTSTRPTINGSPSHKTDIKEDQEVELSNKENGLTGSSPPISPSISVTATEQALSSLPNHLDQTHRRTSGSESDASNSSIGRNVTLTNGHLRTTSRSGVLPRSVSSNATSSRSPVNGLLNAKNRASSYSDMSDAELNDISLDDNSAPGTPRRSFGSTIASPRVPVAASNAGFPSSFFGGKPHPKSQQFQSNVTSPQPTAAATTVVTPPIAPTSPETRASNLRNGSISSIASSIQGAIMGRGFGSNSNTTLPPPPPPVRTPSGSSSARRSITSMIVNTTGIDLRPSNNISPERASTYSTMTTDSNMDLLLARLETENSILEQDNKRRLTTDSEMDRALGHAKEESVEENVDWDYWGALMHDYNGVVKKNPKLLTQNIQKGVPPALRGLIWQLLAKSKDAQLEAKYAELLKATSQHEKQINRDMSRTFPNHEYFQADGLGQESMFNVVKAYSLYDKEVGYCQGLSFVVGPLLLNVNSEFHF